MDHLSNILLINPYPCISFKFFTMGWIFRSPKSHAIWAVALTAFWGCHCLGELLPILNSTFNPTQNVTFNCNIHLTSAHNHRVLCLHIPRTKTTWDCGINFSLVERNDIFCPIRALTDYLSVNRPSPDCSLFVFQDASKPYALSILTKTSFISCTISSYFCPQLLTIFLRLLFFKRRQHRPWPQLPHRRFRQIAFQWCSPSYRHEAWGLDFLVFSHLLETIGYYCP